MSLALVVTNRSFHPGIVAESHSTEGDGQAMPSAQPRLTFPAVADSVREGVAVA
jgi:hypothetical protein